MAISRVDSVNLRIWIITIILAVLTFVNVIVYIIAAHFPGLGFPCAYYEMVDYAALNLSARNDFSQLTPHLYLDAIQSIVYTIFTVIIFLFIIIYYCVCCIRVATNSEKTSNVNQATRDISWLGDSSSCFQLILIMNTFQLFITSLSFRLPMVAAFTYTLFFIFMITFNITMITQYDSFEKSSFNMNRLHPKLNFTIKFKTVLINCIQLELGFSTMVFSMILSLGLGNSFFIISGYVAFSAINFFLILTTIYFLILEFILYRYVKVQFGFHFGVLFGICGIIYPILKYERLYASEWINGIWINIGILSLFWLIFTICRFTRFCIHKTRRYRLLKSIPTEEETQDEF